MTSDIDIHHMRHALNLARRGLGHVAPNPSVGCVLVKNGNVVARGRTAKGGRPHAEAAALEAAGMAAQGATAYVTLEPCAKAGRAGPCAEALVKAGIKRAVIACIDPNPAVNGRGVEILKAAGIETEVGVLEEEAKKLNAGFFLRILEKRPFITLKMATDAEGNIPASGWITGEAARRHVHLERSMHDAILIGAGTAQADNPLLTTRLPGVIHRSVRVALDTNLKIALDSKLVHSAVDNPFWIFYADDPQGKKSALEKAGVRLLPMTDLRSVVRKLAEEGVTRLLVEGGPKIWASFVEAGLYDRVLWYCAPGRADNGLKAPDIKGLPLRLLEKRALGQDSLEIYEKPA